MQIFNKIKLEKGVREDFGVILILGCIASSFFILIAAVMFIEEDAQMKQISKRWQIAVFGLQILPVLFSLITLKSASRRNYWIAVYWTTLLLELVIALLIMFL